MSVWMRRGSGALGIFLVLAYAIACTPTRELVTKSQTQITGDYLGEQICMSCHQAESSHWVHTLHARIFRNPRNELEAKSCEACHGPGSRHLVDVNDRSRIIAFTRQSQTPIMQQNNQCTTCHAGKTHLYWLGSSHQLNDLACSDCHNPMAEFSASGLLRTAGVSKTCSSCHRQEFNEFRKRSHMPLIEGKVSCIDCHSPHGSVTSPLLAGDSVNQVCFKCHAEKRGPFIWEHAPVRDNCLNCHEPHGSNHDQLLTTARPFLYQQCHTNRGHPNDLLTEANLGSGTRPDPRILNRSCQNCHAQIHGSNHPSGVRFHR
ncbi:MAG: DmsE family decaheme c-type cytochrome [Gammaproteobacteria bacterium]|nr:DmsE family decaheme c-type cytochrome [Gammaproteobacteria bacterium]